MQVLLHLSPNLANGDLVQYNTDGTDADNIDNDTYYYVRVVSATEFKLYRYYDDALADRSNLNVDGGTGNPNIYKALQVQEKGDIVRYGPNYVVLYRRTQHK